MNDATGTFQFTYRASVGIIGPSCWAMSSLLCVCTISFTPSRIGRIGRETWSSSLICAAVVVACFMVAIMSNCLPQVLSNVVINTLVSQCFGLSLTAAACYSVQASYTCVLVIHRLGERGWRGQSMASGNHGIMRCIRYAISHCSKCWCRCLPMFRFSSSLFVL